jgi:phage tail sheath protein FI
MAQGSARVTATEIDLSGPTTTQPTGVPAGVIGTAVKGPAFIPVTVGNISDFYDKFGKTDGKKFGPLAVSAWLGEGAGSATFIRTLGAGDGRQRNADGSVTNAGFVVGEQLPSLDDGGYEGNPYANTFGSKGRTYFLGAFMSESVGSTVFSSAGLQSDGDDTAAVIVRGVLMAASGVVLKLSSSFSTDTSDAPASGLVAVEGAANLRGKIIGDVDLSGGKQAFVMLLNGHKGTDSRYPNAVTASFDVRSPAYFANKLNTDPYKLQEAGHCLYAHWDIHPSVAAVTGSALTDDKDGDKRPFAFLTSGSLERDVGSATVPNYETFEDRFSNAKSPWIISQRFGGKPVDLFRFHAIDAGAGVSHNYKVSIENITPSSDPTNKYGTFDVVVRDFLDSDKNVRVINQFRSLSLDPRSDKYISKEIGDVNVFFDFDRDERAQKIVIEGNYPAQSNYIRVEVNPDIELGMVEATALPVGFRGIDHLVTSGSAPLASAAEGVAGISAAVLKNAVTPPLPFRETMTLGEGDRTAVSSMLYWGVQFEHVTNLDNQNVSSLRNKSILSFAKYFPGFSANTAHFATGSNPGQEDTDQFGILDSDRFCNNLFTLENVKVVTSSAGLADDQAWKEATYVRNGNVSANDGAKTRAFKVEDLTVSANRKFAKFTTIMQGGFDGVNLFDRDSAEMNNVAVAADMAWSDRGRENGNCARAYTKALEIMKNVVNVDLQLLVMPGIREEYVTTLAAESVRDRFDALYLMDLVEKDNFNNDIKYATEKPHVGNTIMNFKNRALDNSFAAAYFPDVTMQDPNTRTNLVVPPSVVVLGAMALNDRLGHPWFAPAGFTRGAIGNRAIEAKVRLNQADMDALYDASINPIAAFDGSGGPVVWGQKTLQAAASALDRVNVRRLLIEIRRQVRDIAQTILFEPNRAATLARFTAAVTPRLQRIQAQAGLERFRVIVDSSTTTQQDIENNTVRGKIFVQPTKSVEFVSLDFVVANGLQAE